MKFIRQIGCFENNAGTKHASRRPFTRRLCVLFLNLLLPIISPAEVTISNLIVAQRPGTKLVDISYDVSSTKSASVKILLSILTNNIPIYACNFSGDIGLSVPIGTGRTITWNMAAEWETTARTLGFKVTAEDAAVAGGDPTANQWVNINDRWVRNVYGNGHVTMSDRTTGLMWTYDATENGLVNWESAANLCASLTYAGHSDWFLPSHMPLKDLYSQKSYFSNVASAMYDYYWSSELALSTTWKYWSIDMYRGDEHISGKYDRCYVWPCRVAGQSNPGPRSVVTYADVDNRDYVFNVLSHIGSPTPAVGFHSYAWNTTLTASVAPTVVSNVTKFICTGWLGTGSIISSNGAHSTGPIVLDELVSSITWLWATNYWLDVVSGFNGSVDQVSQWLAPGAEITMTATPYPFRHFLGWSGDTNDAVIGGETITVSMDMPRRVEARFAVDQYSLVYLTSPGGVLAGMTNQLVEHGGAGTPVTAIPTAGYHFAGWSDGEDTACRQDTGITNALLVTASYAINQYSLHYSAGHGGNVTGLTNQTVIHGSDAAPVTGVPLDGYQFLGWSDGMVEAARQEYGVTNALDVTAVFSPCIYTLTLDASGGVVTGAAVQVVFNTPYGDLPIPVRPFHVFAGWWSDSTEAGTQIESETRVVTASDHTLYARWIPFPKIAGTVSYSGGRTGMIHVMATPVIPDYGLLASYLFNGNAEDLSGEDNRGAVTGATLISDRFGLPWRAYRFNGVGDYISCPSLLENYQQGLSISCWIKTASQLETYQTAVCKPRQVGDEGGISLGEDKGTVEAAFNNDPTSNTPGAEQFVLYSPDLISIDNWHHLVTTLDGSTMRFYRDGQLVSDHSYADNGVTSVAQLQIGRTGSGGCHFAGCIDDVNVYNRALNQDEVAMLYQSTTYEVVIAEPGLYVISNMLSGVDYNVHAFIDSNGNGLQDSSELFGAYLYNAIHLTNDVTGIAIEIGLETLQVAVSSSAGGTVHPNGSLPCVYGASTNITILPDPHHHVSDVLVNGVSVGPVNAYSFINVTSNQSVHVLFAVDEHSLSVVSAHGGACPGSLMANYGSGLSLAITNSPVINGWTQYLCTGATASAHSFTQVTPTNAILTLTNNATLTWLWQTRYLLTAYANEGGAVSGAGWFPAGSVVSLTASPEPYYQFVRWSDGNAAATRFVTVPEGGIGFVAIFALIPGGRWDSGYQLIGGGWRRLDWFGNYIPMGGEGWIWHNRHGFLYVSANSTPASIWFYSQNMGWLWTSSTVYPFLFRQADGTWLWYNGSTNPRWFVNMATGFWEAW